MVRYSMQSLTLGAAALLVIDDQISAGAMIAANVMMARALQPLDLIVGSWRGFVAAKDSFKKLEQLLQDYPERDALLQQDELLGEIVLKQLSAQSPDKKFDILKSISAQFKPGEVTCVIGASGSGKSTLARCLVGIWPDLKGDVLLDKVSLQRWDRQQLGPHIGYLPQDVELFDGSIAENIARFYEIDSEQVIVAAKKAGIHDMILRFPKGYDTQIGEAGGFLSGGQRQRLALARAMYGNPQIMVLDEPNANLDDIGEKALAMAIQTMKQEGKTVVLITHRMNILSIADQLMVLKEGKIMHFGARDEVLKSLQAEKSAQQA
jgi:ATP-binding cassette subfamily C exporter for protease/lipase